MIDVMEEESFPFAGCDDNLFASFKAVVLSISDKASNAFPETVYDESLIAALKM